MKLVFMMACLVLLGCTEPRPATTKGQANIAASLRYFRDPGTNLCFASVLTYNGHFEYTVSIAHVPCEPLKGSGKFAE